LAAFLRRSEDVEAMDEKAGKGARVEDEREVSNLGSGTNCWRNRVFYSAWDYTPRRLLFHI